MLRGLNNQPFMSRSRDSAK